MLAVADTVAEWPTVAAVQSLSAVELSFGVVEMPSFLALLPSLPSSIH